MSEAVAAGHICLDMFPILTGSAVLFRPGQTIEAGPVFFSTGSPVSNTGLALHKLGVTIRLMGKNGWPSINTSAKKRSCAMLTKQQLIHAQARTRDFLNRVGIVLTAEEAATIEVADFGLGELETTGLELVVYVNTGRVCAKELVLFPRQTCPEHRHPPVGDEPGKEETFRCRWGTVYLSIEGEATAKSAAQLPVGRESTYTVRHEVVLQPAQQYTIAPNTLHWFQAGDEGAIISEFSTRSRDEFDIFTDPQIRRATIIQ